MTVIIAVGCTDGIVLAADSAASDPEVGTKYPTRKLRRIQDLPICYGGSGDVGLLQKIDDALQTELKPGQTIKRIRQAIKKAVVPILKESKEDHVAYPAPGLNVPPAAILLVAGVQDGVPWILEIERDGRDTSYGNDNGDFWAIGSGKPWAQAIFRPHLYTPRDLRTGSVIAYRVVDDAIELAAGWLARPIHMMTISAAGKVEDGADMKDLEVTCEAWREQEREALSSTLAPRREPVPGIPEPKTE